MTKERGPFSKLYNAVILSADKVVPQVARPFWEAPAGVQIPAISWLISSYQHNFYVGPKTVFFWAPFGKWVSSKN